MQTIQLRNHTEPDGSEWIRKDDLLALLALRIAQLTEAITPGNEWAAHCFGAADELKDISNALATETVTP